MTWTFEDLQNPLTKDRDEVRSLSGDRDPLSKYTLSDEEIETYLSEEGNVLDAAIRATQALYSLYTNQADQTDGDQSTHFSQRAEMKRDLVEALRRMRAERCVPHAMTTQAQHDAADADTTRVPLRFKRGMFRNR